MKPLMQVENLSFAYGEKQILHDLSFSFREGEFISILGPNGSGKSTLMNLISGLMTGYQGKVSFLGQDLPKYNLKELAANRAMIRQEVNFSFPFNVREIVEMGLYANAVPDRKLIDTWLDVMELNDYADRSIHTLSGGEKQRVLFARAMTQNPRLLFLDEAQSNLDVEHIRSIFSKLKRLTVEQNLCVVAIMHDINLASAYSDRFLFLKNGELQAEGGAEMLQTELLNTVYNVTPTIHAGNNRTLVDFFGE